LGAISIPAFEDVEPYLLLDMGTDVLLYYTGWTPRLVTINKKSRDVELVSLRATLGAAALFRVWGMDGGATWITVDDPPRIALVDVVRDRVLSAHPVPSAWGPAVVLGTHVCVAEQHDASTDQVVRMVNRTTGIPARVPLSTGIINGMAAVDDHLVGILVTALGGEPSIVYTVGDDGHVVQRSVLPATAIGTGGGNGGALAAEDGMLWCVVTHSLRNPPVWGHEAEVVSIDATSGAVQRLTRWATTHRYNDIVATGKLLLLTGTSAHIRVPSAPTSFDDDYGILTVLDTTPGAPAFTRLLAGRPGRPLVVGQEIWVPVIENSRTAYLDRYRLP